MFIHTWIFGTISFWLGNRIPLQVWCRATFFNSSIELYISFYSEVAFIAYLMWMRNKAPLCIGYAIWKVVASWRGCIIENNWLLFQKLILKSRLFRIKEVEKGKEKYWFQGMELNVGKIWKIFSSNEFVEKLFHSIQQ